jgi:hypothetical protein
MHVQSLFLALVALATMPRLTLSQAHDRARHHSQPATPRDSAFDALQQRGARVMGVDQYTSLHRFEALTDGGRIELQRDVADTAGVRAIREHLQAVAREFAAGDFTASATVHGRPVPGSDVMRARRNAIRYEFRPLPRGGEIRITTRDARVLRAVHEFLAFQRADHRTKQN